MKISREFTTLSANLLTLILLSHCLMCGAYLMCEELPIELCAYSVSSTGALCVLEAKFVRNKEVKYKCQTSSVMGESSEGWIESDDCMKACGLNRMTVGISTDTLSDPRVLTKLCAPRCYNSCPHLILLHNQLAIAEGSSSLEEVCKTLNNPHRQMNEFGGKYTKSGYFGAPRGDHGFFGGSHMFGKDCGSFGCSSGGFALPPQTSAYFNHGGEHFFGDHGGPHRSHGWKGGHFDPFYNPFYPQPSENSLPPSFYSPPSPDTLPPSSDFASSPN